jgi:hypothetical protein
MLTVQIGLRSCGSGNDTASRYELASSDVDSKLEVYRIRDYKDSIRS